MIAERLARLGEILVALSGSPLPTHLFQTLADQAPSVVPGDYLALCLRDPDGGGYCAHSLAAVDPAMLGSRALGMDEGLAGAVMRTGRPCVVDDLGAEPDGVSDLEAACRTAGLRAAAVVPLRRGIDVLGALFFAARPPRIYTAEDVQLATLLAAGVAAGLETSRAYQTLADERSTLEAVLGSTQDAVLVVNQEGLVLLANPAVRAMLGLAPDAITGHRLGDVPVPAALRRLLEAGRPGAAEVTLPDGRTAQASAVAVTTAFGEPIGVAAVLRDITLLKNLAQMKNDFVNTVSHDLKNPITVILATAELMVLTGAVDGRGREQAERIRGSARYMHQLVTDLLDLGRIEARLQAPAERVNLAAVVEDAMTVTQPQADAKHITLSAHFPREALVMASTTRLKQVLLNLIGNAVKYTPASGSVTVSLSLGDGTATVRIVDTGIGIPAAHLPYVFDKFYRVKSDATKDIPGTGLGLAITKSIVEAHGGRIWAESVDGQGSTFAFCLSLAEADETAEARSLQRRG